MLCCCLGLFSYIFLQKAFFPLFLLLEHTQKELRYLFFSIRAKKQRLDSAQKWVDFSMGRCFGSTVNSLFTLFDYPQIDDTSLSGAHSDALFFSYPSDIYFAGQIDFPPLFFFYSVCTFFPNSNLNIREFAFNVNFPTNFFAGRNSLFFYLRLRCFFFWFNKKSIEALFFCSDSCSMNELLWSY